MNDNLEFETNCAECIFNIALSLLRYSPDAPTLAETSLSSIKKAIESARLAFQNYGIPIYSNSKACIEAHEKLLIHCKEL